MAHDRIIRISLWEDPTFNELSHSARLLFIGMFSNADDDGYFRADIKSLKRLIFGSDDILLSNVAQYLEEIKTRFRNIHFYEDENNKEQYAHFVKWDFYQKQDERWRKSTIFPHCPCDTRENLVSVSRETSAKENTREENTREENLPPKAPPFFPTAKKKGEREIEISHDDDDGQTKNSIPQPLSGVTLNQKLENERRALIVRFSSPTS